MIKLVNVSGFKTLLNFQLELHPGLNILVGPNGSGKTNIISFFEFLGLLIDMNIADAINISGGAGSIFRKTGEKEYTTNIAAKIVGTVKYEAHKYLYYCYEFTINIHDSGESIVYSQQKFKIKRRTVDTINENTIKDYDLDIERTIDKNLKTKIVVNRVSSDFIGFRYSQRRKKIENSDYIEDLGDNLDHFIGPDECIIKIINIMLKDRKKANLIRSDLRGGKVYNIEPSKVKIPDDSARKPGVDKDGSGLYSTLYSIKKFEEFKTNDYYFPVFSERYAYYPVKIDDIIKYVRLANEGIKDLEINNNPFDKQLQIKVHLMGDIDTILPFASMSDGTVKWICLITIILTNHTMYSIEEPENYLHPRMLSELMSIMRSNIKKNMFVILSTHSETLINNSKVNEVIVVSYANGKTNASRVKNAIELSEEIRKTGFGLGYYYTAGCIEIE
jgi:predicted ATPase